MRRKERHGGGIKGLMLKKVRRAEIPSVKGPCEACSEPGSVRYFVAAKLPRILHLCDKHYLEVRDVLEKYLAYILKEKGFITE